MADFNLKQGDLEPAVQISLVDSAGVPVDVTTATSVRFRMGETLTRVELFSRDATIDDPLLGQLTYVWQTGDTATAGVFYGEFVVEWPGDRPQTYPADGYLTITVQPVV